MTHRTPIPQNQPPGEPPEPPFPSPEPVKRCLTCYYVISHLPQNVCPECGRAFDPGDPTSYTTKPPFLWWRFWMPGFVLAFGLGIISYILLLPATGFGWSLALVLPLAMGALIGYAVRLTLRLRLGTAVVALLTLLLVIQAGGAAGVFCFLLLLVLATLPLLVGCALGAILRGILKSSQWDHRSWLPIVLFMLLPFGSAAIETRMPPPPVRIVQTSRTIDASLAASWDGVLFYEEVTHDPPLLLRLTLRRPLATRGRIDRVGGRKVCLYVRGHLVKQVTALDPLERLEFAVIEQVQFEEYSVRLLGGSFAFEPLGPRRTRVTLTTRYEPLLRPRWAWRAAEAYVTHLLHEHVLEGMARRAEQRDAVAETGATAEPHDAGVGAR